MLAEGLIIEDLTYMVQQHDLEDRCILGGKTLTLAMCSRRGLSHVGRTIDTHIHSHLRATLNTLCVLILIGRYKRGVQKVRRYIIEGHLRVKLGLLRRSRW